MYYSSIYRIGLDQPPSQCHSESYQHVSRSQTLLSPPTTHITTNLHSNPIFTLPLQLSTLLMTLSFHNQSYQSKFTVCEWGERDLFYFPLIASILTFQVPGKLDSKSKGRQSVERKSDTPETRVHPKDVTVPSTVYRDRCGPGVLDLPSRFMMRVVMIKNCRTRL